MKQTHMYVCTFEEFILVDIWIHCCTNWNLNWTEYALEKYCIIYTRNKGLVIMRIALRSLLTSES